MAGLEPTVAAPKARGVPLPYIPVCVGDPCGIRTRPGRPEGPVTSAEVERACSARTGCAVGREALESSARRLRRLSYRPVIGVDIGADKKARCLRDTGLR